MDRFSLERPRGVQSRVTAIPNGVASRGSLRAVPAWIVMWVVIFKAKRSDRVKVDVSIQMQQPAKLTSVSRWCYERPPVPMRKPSRSLLELCWLTERASQKISNQLCDLVWLLVERKVAGIEDV